MQRLTIARDFPWVFAIERAELASRQGEPCTRKPRSIFVLEKEARRWWVVAHSLSARRERPGS